jgi:hypothetical protein
MTPQMRDEVNLMATKLQRRKTDKRERITANTLMRVAIQVLLDGFGLEEWDVANDEEELLQLAKSKLIKR